MGVEIAEGTATVGKFLSNTLTGNDDQYNKFNELEVYYDLERCLKDEVDNLIYDIDDGDIVAARRFLTAYGMLQNTYNVNMDCYEEYIDKLYKAGLLNNVFPGINSDKYERKYSECESVRESTNNMFLEDIAKAGNVCRSKCCQLFNRYFHMTPMQFLNKYRLTVSRNLIISTPLPSAEIAASCGFPNQSYYIKIFTSYFGMTPAEFRRKNIRETSLPDNNI